MSSWAEPVQGRRDRVELIVVQMRVDPCRRGDRLVPYGLLDEPEISSRHPRQTSEGATECVRGDGRADPRPTLGGRRATARFVATAGSDSLASQYPLT